MFTIEEAERHPEARQMSNLLSSTVIGVGLLVGLTALLVGLPSASAAVQEGVGTGTRYVAISGDDSLNDCTDSKTPCLTIQHAVDAANAAEEVRVAAGAYTGTRVMSRTEFSTVYTYTQVVYIDKNLILQGGYTTTDWTTSDPMANPTVIDAQRQGRGVTVLGIGPSQVVTVDGFTLTGGDYTGLGNPAGVSNQACINASEDCGGGLFVYNSAIHLRNSIIWENIAGRGPGQSYGGGIFLWNARASSIENTLVYSNSASSGGGGLMVIRQYWPLNIRGSTFLENSAADGGGIFLRTNIHDLVSVVDTTLIGNTAQTGDGGGMLAVLTEDGQILHLDRVTFQENKAMGLGKALRLDGAGLVAPEAKLTNLLLIGNTTLSETPTAEDAVVAIGQGAADLQVTLAHVTAADNPVETFLFAQPSTYQGGRPVSVTLANTLLSDFTYGFAAREEATGEVTIQHTKSLLHNVISPTFSLGGSPTFIAVGPVGGDPLLDAGYHLQAGSAAIDAGINAGLSHDIDGEYRPQSTAPDIGADEFYQLAPPSQLTLAGPSHVLAQSPATYTAGVMPMEATQPITYIWQATGLDPVTHTGGLTDSASLVWDTAGSKIITVTAINAVNEIAETYPVDVTGAPELAIRKDAPAEAIAGTAITYILTISNEGVVPANDLLVTDTVPSNVSSVKPLDDGTLVDEEVHWALSSLSGGMSTTVRFLVTATQTITNYDYRVSASGGYSDTGTTPVVTVFNAETKTWVFLPVVIKQANAPSVSNAHGFQ